MPDTPEIDLSGGLQPKAITATGQQASPEIDLSAGLQPKPGPTAADAVIGPNTALGAPLSPTQSSEMSGIQDIFKGNFKEGAGKLYNAEIGSMHVIQGSPLEKAIKVFNPNFQGGITPSEAERQRHETYRAIESPAVNISQFVDKEQHPVWKAVSESAESLTSPENVAIMASTGGLGLVQSPKALAVANRLLSAGFSAQAIGQAYQHFKEFKDAYDRGDSSEALYQITHGVLSGALAYTAGAHGLAGKPLTATPEPGTPAAKVGEVLGAGAKAVAGAPGQLVSSAKEALDLNKSFTDLIRKASPPSKGAALEYDQRLKEAEPQLREVLKNTRPTSPEEAYKALDQHIRSQEGNLQKKAQQYRGTEQANLPGIYNATEKAVNQAFDEAGGQYTGEERRQAVNAVLNHLRQEAGVDERGNTTYRNPDLFEAEGVRQRFNDDANPVFGSNAPAVPKAEAYAKAVAAGILRNAIDAKYDELGVGDVKEWRKQEAALIDVRDQIAKAQNKATDMGEFSAWNSLWKQLGWKTMLGMATGAQGGLEGMTIGGIGANLLGVLADYIRDVKTNPNRLIQRAVEKAGEVPSGARTPDFTGLNRVPQQYEIPTEPALARTGKSKGLGPSEQTRGHEWGHVIVAHKEGFPSEEIRSHLHPSIKNDPTTGAETLLNLDSLKVNNSGRIPLANVRQNLDKLLAIGMGGAAADEIHADVPLEKNRGVAGDNQWANNILRKLGFSPEESKTMLKAAFDRAKAHLTDPDARDILLENRDVRKAGLPDTLHADKDQIAAAMEELDRRQNARNNKGLEEDNGEHGEPAVAGREGAPAGRPASKVVKGLRERSTGNKAVDSIIKEGGGVPAGMMEQLALFHDPQTGSTLAHNLEKGEITPDTVRDQLAKSRAAFEAAPALRQQEDRISTRVPTSAVAEEDHLTGEPLTVGLEAVNASRGLPEKLASKVSDYTGVKIPSNIKDPAKINDRFINHVVDNLKFLYGESTPKEQTDNAKWYESAHKLSREESEKYGIEHRQAAGAIAAMSPQKDWDMNVSLARRVMDIFHNQKDFAASPEMIQKGRDIVERTSKGGKKANENLDGLLNKIAGKKFSELTDPMEKAAWIRLYDETYNPREYHKIDPATGNNLDLARNQNGQPGRVAWGSLNQIGNAVSVLEDGSRENISDALGGNHKVRNFYNNMIDPTNGRDVTIDTHAVAAGLLRPLAGNDLEVKQNFGGISNAKTGSHGTYPLYAEAYRRAAADLGIKPRELQSVTWEKVRDLFPAEWKTEANKKAVDKIWKTYDNGKVTLAKARQGILDLASRAAEPEKPVPQPARAVPKAPTGRQALAGE